MRNDSSDRDNFETAFFLLTPAAIAVVLVLHFFGNLVPPAAMAQEESAGYRLTITAQRLPVECRVNGGMNGKQYCAQFYDRGVTERMQRIER